MITITAMIRRGGASSEDGDSQPLASEMGGWQKSGKMKVVHALLNMWLPQGHKVLLFVQTRQMLEILEKMASQCLFQYLRMDGTTPVRRRSLLVDEYNSSNPNIFLFFANDQGGWSWCQPHRSQPESLSLTRIGTLPPICKLVNVPGDWDKRGMSLFTD